MWSAAQALALVAVLADPPKAELILENAPEGTIVRCLEGCEEWTWRLQLADAVHPFAIDEAERTVKLWMLASRHRPRVVDVTVRPGRNVVDATLELHRLSQPHAADPTEVELFFENAPKDTIVQCLEGCEEMTSYPRAAEAYDPFAIGEAERTVKLSIRAEAHDPRIVELVVRPGRNVVDATLEPRPSQRCPASLPKVELVFENAPKDTIVKCLEGCGDRTGLRQFAEAFSPFTIDEAERTVKLSMLARSYSPRRVEVLVRPGRNVVDATLEPGAPKRCPSKRRPSKRRPSRC